MKRKFVLLKYAVAFIVISYSMYLSVYRSLPTKQVPTKEPVVVHPRQFNTACLTDNVERNVDNHHRDTHRKFWDQLSDKSIQIYTQVWKQFIDQEKRKPIPDWPTLEGIVFVAGNDDTLKRTMGTIRLLQTEFKCVLPIEIWHMEQEADAAALFMPEIKSFKNVSLRDLSDIGLAKPLSRSRGRTKQ